MEGDFKWYSSTSRDANLPPRCPYASVHRCPRYYESASLLGDAGLITKIEAGQEAQLLSKWSASDLWPVISEDAVAITGSGQGFSNFCPEVAFNVFKVFATSLARFADEVDQGNRHRVLERAGAGSDDWRWRWEGIAPQHYSACRLYSLLSAGDSKKSGVARAEASGAPDASEARHFLERASMPKANDIIHVFFSYAHEDEDLMNQVRRQLIVYERIGQIVKWHDRKIPAGKEWKTEIDDRLREADVVLMFLSPRFIESKYCYEVEGKVALERARRGEVAVIPVILRPCAWTKTPYAEFQALPIDAKPLSTWKDRDKAALNVAEGVMSVVEEFIAKRRCG